MPRLARVRSRLAGRERKRDNFSSPRIYHYVLDMCALSIDKTCKIKGVETGWPDSRFGNANFVSTYHRSCLGNGAVNLYLAVFRRRKFYREARRLARGSLVNRTTRNRRRRKERKRAWRVQVHIQFLHIFGT